MSVIVSPSLLAADFMNLGKDVEMVNRSKADWIHLDIMDGVFVPNISYGLPVVSQIKKIARKPLDVHLMIVQPERYVEAFHKAGADILTVHLEASTHLHRTLQQIKALGMKAGVALNPPHSCQPARRHYTGYRCGADYERESRLRRAIIYRTFAPKKVKKLKALIQATHKHTPDRNRRRSKFRNRTGIVAAGANALVAGSFVFKSEDPGSDYCRIKELKNGVGLRTAYSNLNLVFQ